MKFYIDADACPVKDEVYKVARRYSLEVLVVSNSHMRVPFETGIKAVVVGSGFDEADDWIADNVEEDDVVITTDIPLSARCIEAGAWVVNHKGFIQDEATIGNSMANRELMDLLRQMGETTGGPKPMAKKDRSCFLATLDQIVQRDKNSR